MESGGVFGTACPRLGGASVVGGGPGAAFNGAGINSGPGRGGVAFIGGVRSRHGGAGFPGGGSGPLGTSRVGLGTSGTPVIC